MVVLRRRLRRRHHPSSCYALRQGTVYVTLATSPERSWCSRHLCRGERHFTLGTDAMSDRVVQRWSPSVDRALGHYPGAMRCRVDGSR